MPILIDPQSLDNAAVQYDALIPGQNMKEAVMILLLANIAGMQGQTPDQLAAAAKCYDDQIPDGAMKKAVIIFLLTQIVG
jgi:hypothetical protein